MIYDCKIFNQNLIIIVANIKEFKFTYYFRDSEQEIKTGFDELKKF
jgi:hypothetical protein